MDLISFQVTKEGEVLPFYQQELQVGADGGEDRLMFIWPTTVVHKIDRHSPLYRLSASDMLKERFEVVCILGKQHPRISWIFIVSRIQDVYFYIYISVFYLSKMPSNQDQNSCDISEINF